jgi:hypothetical protein
VTRLTLGTLLLIGGVFLAGCGGGAGSIAPRASGATNVTAGAKQVLGAVAQPQAVCPPLRPHRGSCTAMVTRSAAPASAVRALAKKSLPDGYGPDDFQDAYDLAKAAKKNAGLVAIVAAYDNPNAEADLAVYRKTFGLPPCTTANGCFRKVGQTGSRSALPPYPFVTPDYDPTSWLVESSLDLDMVSAICPKCSILLVETNDDFMNNLGAGVDTAASFHPIAISNSYVSQELPTDPGPVSKDGLLPHYVHPGIAVVAATGDYGYSLDPSAPNAFGGPTGALVPASFPSVVAVGGTTLTRDGSTARGWTEAALQQAGSGCSAYEPMAPWQTASASCVAHYTGPAGNELAFPARMYGDVAFDGDSGTGMAVYDTNNDGWFPNKWGVVGGTSMSAPAVAAIYALAGYGSGDDNDDFPARKLYRSRSSLYDVTSGLNGFCSPAWLCTAGPGYDAPTGNGTPNGTGAF